MMMDASKGTTIKCGSYELVLSQQIIMDSLESEINIDLTIYGIRLGNLIIRFIQKEDEEFVINFHGEDGKVVLECVNFEGKADAGTIELMPIGTVQGKELKMHLWTKLLGNHKVRKVEINLYKEQ